MRKKTNSDPNYDELVAALMVVLSILFGLAFISAFSLDRFMASTAPDEYYFRDTPVEPGMPHGHPIHRE